MNGRAQAKYQRILRLVDEARIYFEYLPLRSYKQDLLGFYVWDPSDNTSAIGLDKRLQANPPLELCVLTEEYMHHITGSQTDSIYIAENYRRYGDCNEILLMRKSEERALRRTADFLLPDVELCQALSEGCRSCYDLAEWFGVTEWMVHRKLGFLTLCFRRNGLKVKGRDLLNIKLCEIDVNVLDSK